MSRSLQSLFGHWLRPTARRGTLVVVLAMALAAVLALSGLDHQLFWDDEANTAIYARNLLRFGRLTAWDGTNLVAYSYGGALGEDLGQELRVPGLPAYVAALGMSLCGETTLGGRILFALAGVLAVGLLAVWTRRLLGRHFPWYLPSLILALSPAYLLYIRNCRYYSLGVLLSLVLWTVWTPGSEAGILQRTWWRDRRFWLRCLAGAMGAWLLLGTHYLGAVAAVACLPVFFLDRRFRRPQQYVLLGVICAAAILYGVVLLAQSNPLAADYEPPPDSFQAPSDQPLDPWTRFYVNLGKYVRDLGTHEFFPLAVLLIFPFPWLAGRARALRPWVRRGGVLVLATLVYLATAAVLTPSDMGRGPFAEMRYVVPLTLIGAMAGGLAVAILCRTARPVAAVAFLLLVGTNLLHLGPLAQRGDQTSSWWPPTLWRYVAEIFDDYPTGSKAMVDRLRQLPEGTTVRIWPPYLVYPPMFYVPQQHYCDQLAPSKPIGPELRRELPEYLFVGRSRPEVILVAVPFLRQKLGEIEFLQPGDRYELTQVLPPYWNYTSKPEIPVHFFSAPPSSWDRYPGIAVLVRTGSRVAGNRALQIDPTDPEAVSRLGTGYVAAGNNEMAKRLLREAVRMDPRRATAHLHLGLLLMMEGQDAEAAEHLQAAVTEDPQSWRARMDFGTVLVRLGDLGGARRQYLAALKINPKAATIHYNLGNLALREAASPGPASPYPMPQGGGFDEAIEHYQKALELDPKYAAAHVNWGNALFMQGQLEGSQNQIEQAVEHYRAALEIDDDLVPAHVQLGMALHALGDTPAARSELREALELLPPDSPAAEQVRAKLGQLGGP